MVEPSAVGGCEESLTAGVLALELEDSPVELVAGAAVSVDRSLKSSEACVLAFGPAREGRRGCQPLRPVH